MSLLLRISFHYRKLFSAFMLTFWLVGCASSVSSIPPYVVMLTQSYPSAVERCTGVAIGPKSILTARHCVGTVNRIITQDGQEAYAVDAQIMPTNDAAILTVNKVLWMTEYAQLGEAHSGTARIFGTCPFYWGHQARQALYIDRQNIQIGETEFADFDSWFVTGDDSGVCGGDSGGMVIQGNTVVGTISMVEADVFWVKWGTLFYTVPSLDVSEWYAQ